jgi:hypothetical protein
MTMRGEQFRYLALAILLAIGAGLIWGFAGVWCMSIISDAVSSGQLHEQLLFLGDGTPVIESYVGRHYESRTFRNLDGKNIEVTYNAFRNGERLQGPEYQSKKFTGLRWNERIVCVYNYWYGPEVWYFVHDGKLEGHGYYVGYDKTAKATIGYIGCDGFRADEPPLDRQFPVDGRRMSNYSYGGTALVHSYYDRLHDAIYLLADDGLRAVNVKKRTVTLLRKGDDLISGALSRRPGSADEIESPESKAGPSILLRTPERVIVLAPDGKQLDNYPLPPELRQDTFQWFAIQDGKVLVYRDIFGDAELTWLERGGKTVRHEHIELLKSGQSEFMKNAAVSAIAPSPATIAGFAVCYPWSPAECPESWTYSDALSKAISKIWPAFLATGIVSVVLACVCYRRQRMYGLPWTGIWTVFVLLFGLPAFFGYLSHRAWPARLPCPNCGRRVPRDRPACFACNHEFPPPAAKGNEVFA